MHRPLAGVDAQAGGAEDAWRGGWGWGWAGVGGGGVGGGAGAGSAGGGQRANWREGDGGCQGRAWGGREAGQAKAMREAARRLEDGWRRAWGKAVKKERHPRAPPQPTCQHDPLLTSTTRPAATTQRPHSHPAHPPVMVTLSPGLQPSTLVSNAYISSERGVSPSGTLEGSSWGWGVGRGGLLSWGPRRGARVSGPVSWFERKVGGASDGREAHEYCRQGLHIYVY